MYDVRTLVEQYKYLATKDGRPTNPHCEQPIRRLAGSLETRMELPNLLARTDKKRDLVDDTLKQSRMATTTVTPRYFKSVLLQH